MEDPGQNLGYDIRHSKNNNKQKKHDCWSVPMEEYSMAFTNGDFLQIFG